MTDAITPSPAPMLPLDDVRVLDLTGQLGQYAGRLLADQGADVIRVEPPAGSPARVQPPFFHDDPDENRSLDFWYFNANKRGLTLNLETEDGQALLRQLIATADVIIDSYPPAERARLLPGDEEVEQLNPRLIRCSITGFGLWGPYAEYQAPDLVAVAMSGIMTLAGYPDRAPTMPPLNQGYLSAAIQAAQGIMAALLVRDSTGRGQTVEVSVQEAVQLSQETAMQYWDMRRELRRRTGDARRLPGFGTYACADGHVFIMVGLGRAGAPWSTMVEWMAEEGMAGDLDQPEWVEFLSPENMRALTLVAPTSTEALAARPKIEHVDAIFGRFLLTKTKLELYEEGQRRRLLVGPVNSARDLVENRQLNAREWYQQIEHPELGTTVTYPGPPYRPSETPVSIRRRPPLLGEHTQEILKADLGLTDEQITALMGAGVI